MDKQIYSRTDVTFDANGVKLAGWLYRPSAAKAAPAIVMTSGYACVKELFVDKFAEAFAEAGFAVLLYDHRNFGNSGGEPRDEINPLQQIADTREAITWLELQEGIDANRIGLWGSSYSGGHAIVLGAMDRRLRSIVAQVPTISGYQTFLRRTPPTLVASVREAYRRDRHARYRGDAPEMRRVIPEGDQAGVYNGADAVAFWSAAEDLAPNWRNSITLRSTEMASEYEPGLWIDRIGPTPFLMIVAEADDVTPTDLALAAYQRAVEPKQLCIMPGGHFDPYGKQFDRTSKAACDWFLKSLA